MTQHNASTTIDPAVERRRPPSRTVLERTIVLDGSSDVSAESTDQLSSQEQNRHPERALRLMMLGCEDNPPYGPNEHTAAMFLDLICHALERQVKQEQLEKVTYRVSIAVYHVKQFDFPNTISEWDSYDGILLPGSFSSAYDETDWIVELKFNLHQHVFFKRPTLGICFGHQIYAHAMPNGLAVKCPSGPQAGRRKLTLSTAGTKMLSPTSSSSALQLYYTHGDMVQKLPPCAVSLGGNESVPILAAAYFRSAQDAEAYVATPHSKLRPTAITFQAHPEYASNQALGVQKTLKSILLTMKKRGDIKREEERTAMEQDALEHYRLVEEDSVEAMRRTGVLLGWFPEKSD